MERTTNESLTLSALLVAVIATIFGATGVGLALTRDGGGSGAGGGGAQVQVELNEFKISPSDITVASGDDVLTIRNVGSVEHDFQIEGGPQTDKIAAGGSATLPLGGLAAGTYTIRCTVPGHEGSGMSGTLVVGGDGASSESASGESTTAGPAESDASGNHAHLAKSVAAMDEEMIASLAAFPAETEGQGGQLLEHTVAADGTWEFNLTAKVVDWEVSPGTTVKAWTYNGTVPGPTIKADPGVNVRIILKNELPESTAIHFHGLKTPNSMDGVTGVTQDPVLPGETFTYEFPAIGPAVGMYHSHHMAVYQVPDGMAGAFLIGGPKTTTGQPPIKEETMMLNDAGVIGFSINGKSFPATAPYTLNMGETMVVHYLNEGVQAHPMHLHGMTQTVIAKDGIPLEQSYVADTINVAPGERYTVQITADVPGTWVWHCHILSHAENDTGMFGMVTALVVPDPNAPAG